jgi:hypothetical protein
VAAEEDGASHLSTAQRIFGMGTFLTSEAFWRAEQPLADAIALRLPRPKMGRAFELA